MLGRAVKKNQADAPSARPGKTELAKQLFPSSSPAAHNGDLTQWVSHKGRANLLSNTVSGSSKAAGNDPLQLRSNNPEQPRRPQYKPISSNSSTINMAKRSDNFASLYTNAGSFQEDPEPANGTSQAKAPLSSFYADDDFSDDNTLELDMDYQLPASLPPQPAAKKPPANPIPQPPTSQMTWPSSPRDHLFPPKNSENKSAKRESPDGVSRLGPPPAKKRSLPSSWKREYSAVAYQEHAPEETKQASVTPAPNKKDITLWDTTASATKERRKQLKNQNKKSEPEPGFSAEEMAATSNYIKQMSKSSAISLSSEQQHVIDLVMKKKQSVFFTGPAGTGKSVLMRAIIAELKKKWKRDPERINVTASTGLAACNIGGMTLHSFAGIGLGKEDVPTLVKKIRRNAKVKNRWLRTSVLVIDEVSMVDGELFDKLSRIASTIRNNGRPWGGIQLVITGDFFQLPPVPDSGKKDTKFAFEAGTWNTSIDHTIGLTQVFRQKDPHFANMLNEMRLGRISEDTVKTFQGLARPLQFDDDLEVTELFPTRQEVERSNDFRLRNLPGKIQLYDAYDSGEPQQRERLLANMMAPKTISLKVGAQVMLIKNLDDQLVNGSLGKVIDFRTEEEFEYYSNRVSEDVPGDEALEASARLASKVKAFIRNSAASKADSSSGIKYPHVRFTTTDGTHRSILVTVEDWKVELPTGEVQASRKQLPLILAWALSIHKAQGQTLERVKVDLGKVFEKGQAYVALSRAVSKQGLQVLNFDKRKVMAHPRVIQFYNKLYSAESALKAKKPSTIQDYAFKDSSTLPRKKDVEAINLVDEEEEEMMAAHGF